MLLFQLISLLISANLFINIGAYKVLVFNPAYGASHANFLGKISDILIDAGNDVTMLMPTYIWSKQNQTGSKKVQNVVKIGQDPRTGKIFEEGGIESIVSSKVWTMDAQMMSLVRMIGKMNTGIGYQCEYIFQQVEVLEKLRDENFDLAITESLFSCGFALFDHIGIQTIINAESNLFKDSMKHALGEPAAISYYPGLFSPNPDKMSFIQRIKNLVGMLFTNYLFGSRYTAELRQITPYYKKGKTWNELLSSVAFSFVNSNQFIDYPSATLPKTVFVGGMQVNTKKNGRIPLSEDWDELLDKRAQNVLISFGSQAHSSEMPEDFKSAFLQVFASMPDTTFIWKYEEANATLADHLPNVHLTTWMPQNDLLADDRLSLFVTHGGLGSTMELAYQGKPAVIIPLLGDQPRNAHMLTRHGGAFQLHKKNLNKPEVIKNAILTVLEDSSYKKNAEKLAKILEEQPFQPKEVVLRHCDFAVKHGALETLNSEGRNLNTLQYYSVDIAVLVLVVVIVLIAVIVALLVMSKRAVKLVVEKVRCTWKKSKLD